MSFYSIPKMLKNKKFGITISVLLFVAILLMGDFDPSKSHLNTMAAIAVLMAVLWITEAIPLSVTSLIPLIFYPLTGILTAEEIAASAEILQPTYEATNGRDGYMSVEVSPLHRTAAAMVKEALELFAAINTERGGPEQPPFLTNIMFKIPATPAGL